MRYYHNWRNYDLMAAILSNSALGIYFLYNEIERLFNDTTKRDPKKYPNAMDDPDNSYMFTNTVRMLTCLLSFAGLFCLVQRHVIKCKWRGELFTNDKETKLYFRYKEVTAEQHDVFKPHHVKLFNLHFLLEILIMIANPIPFFDVYIHHKAKSGIHVHYFFSEIMLSIMALRLLLGVRSYFNYSVYTDNYTKKLCQQYGFDSNIEFAIKACLINKPVHTICLLFATSIIVEAYILRIYEMQYFRNLPEDDPNFCQMESVYQSVWLVIVTLTTVGYGDIFACTLPGRVVTLIIALSGSLLMALTVTTVTQQLDLSTKKKIALHHMQLTHAASSTVKSSISYYMAKKKYELYFKIAHPEKATNSKFLKYYEQRCPRHKDEIEDMQKDIRKCNTKQVDQDLERLKKNMEATRGQMINDVRSFIQERTEMDRIIDEERRTLNVQTSRINKTCEDLSEDMQGMQQLMLKQNFELRELKN